MSSKAYTVMVVGGAHQEVRRHSIPKRTIAAAAALSGALLIAVLAVSVHYAVLTQDVFTARDLAAENESLRARLTGLKAQVEGVEARLRGLHQHDVQLRELTHVRSAAPELAIGPLRRPTGASGGGTDIDAFAVPLAASTADGALLGEELTSGRMDSVLRDVTRQTASLKDLIAYYSAQERLLAATPSVWPTKGWITSTFGFRSDPFTGGKVMHAGIDLAAPDGTQVLAPAAGTIIYAGDRGGYGNMIAIDHGRGLVTQYGHLSRVLVKVGDKVTRGHHIGAVGNTGRSTGPHLHYEVRQNGVPINPRQYVLEW